MNAIFGPILASSGGYVFDKWSEDAGVEGSFAYQRIEDAYYARTATIRAERSAHRNLAVCDTLTDFEAAVATWCRAPSPGFLYRHVRP